MLDGVGMDGTPISPLSAPEPVPSTLDWDVWLSQAQTEGYHKDFTMVNGDAGTITGMGALGDWGSISIDTAHEFLDLGLPF